MIFYDTMTIRLQELDGNQDPVDDSYVEVDVDCEAWPVQSNEADRDASPATRYRFATSYDMEALADLVPPGWASYEREIFYRGTRLSLPAGYERFTISGRLDHYEFLANDPGDD